MASESEIIKLEILGTRLQLRGGDDPETVRQVAEYVKNRVNEIADLAPTTPSLQVALLAAINIADDLLAESHRRDDIIDAAAKKAQAILSKSGG